MRLWLMALALLMAVPAHADRRALVIGNAAYVKKALQNPVRDARAIAKALEGLDFQVELHVDLTHHQLSDAIKDFFKTVKSPDVVVVYYAGHGTQAEGENFLLGINFEESDPYDTREKAYRLSSLMGRLNRTKARTKIVILDACRDNPFGWGRSAGSRGFVPLRAKPRNTYIAFSTDDGELADDGPGKPHSPFATALLARIKTANQDVNDLFRAVRSDVERATGDRQSPISKDNLVSPFYFNRTDGPAAPRAPVSAPPRARPPAKNITLTVSVEPVDARVRVNGYAKELTFNQAQFELPRQLPEVQVHVEPKGASGRAYRPYTQTYGLKGKDKDIDITLVRRPKTIDDHAVPITSFIVGAALAGTGVAFHVLAFEAADDAQTLVDRADDGSVTVAEVNEKLDERQGFLIGAGVAYGAAVVALGFGLYTLYRDDEPSVSVFATPGGMGVGGRF